MKAALTAMLLGSSLALAQTWEKLPPIPDDEGFAGAFAGQSGGALLVAGGAHIVGDKWGETFTKQWYPQVFALTDPAGPWKSAGELPRPLGYGVSISADDTLLCLGGSDSQRHYADGVRLLYAKGKLTIRPFPPLPSPCANSCGALVGRTIYVAGGIENPTATRALHNFWALDLAAPEPQWRELEPWPGPERMLSVAGAAEGSFFLFSGASLEAGPDGKPLRTFLRDAYRFTPGKGWQRLADLPRPAVAAASPALVAGGRLLIPSGDDGENVNFEPVRDHPGFPRDLLAYDPATDRWENAVPMPFSRATVPAAAWQGRIVIPNGEVRPRLRTNEVWAVKLP